MNGKAALKDDFGVKFWGMYCNLPAPGCDTVRCGGNTACVEVPLGEHTISLDSGPGIIPRGWWTSERLPYAGQPGHGGLYKTGSYRR